MPSGAGHRGVTICGCAIICSAVFLVLATFAALRRCYQSTVLAVWTVRRLYALWVPANTPWKQVRLVFGLGIRAARRAIKSNGSKMTWVVPGPKAFAALMGPAFSVRRL